MVGDAGGCGEQNNLGPCELAKLGESGDPGDLPRHYDLVRMGFQKRLMTVDIILSLVN